MDAKVVAHKAEIPTLADTLVSTNKVRFIAHRGAETIAPENTIPAFEWAGKMGFWGAETDILVTSDGELVVFHDDTVDRMTDGTGNVADLTLTQIKALKIDAGANIGKYPNLRVPTLNEYLEVCKREGLVPVMELKSSNFTSANIDKFIDTIKAYGFEEKCIVISFYLANLQAVRSRSTKIVLQYLTDINDGRIADIKALGNAGFDCSFSNPPLTKALVEQAHLNGLHVNSWGLTTVTQIRNMISYGVDMITSGLIGGDRG